ncbi:MAG: hypothetical protein GX207_03055 [Peptococcaceae bacterium]|nr:hypothetical protein [Peptococcaceae bacterium]
MKKIYFFYRFKRCKLKDKLFVFFFTVLLIMCVLSIIAFRVAFNFYDAQLYNEAAKVLNLLSTSVENELKKIEKLSFLILSDPNVQQQLLTIKNLPQGYHGYQATENLQGILLSYSLSENYISSISIVDSKGGQFIVGVETGLNKEQNEQILQEALKYGGKNVWIEPGVVDNMLKSARVIRRISGLSLDFLGLLVIRVDMNKLINQIAHIYPGFELYLQIFSQGKNIYSTTESNIRLEDDFFGLTWGKNYGIKTVDRKKYFIAYTESSYTGWVYVNIIPFENINQKIMLLRNIMILFFTGILGLLAFIGLKLTKSITKPIENLALQMKQVESGDFNVEEGFNTDCNIEEIAALNKDFKLMIQKKLSPYNGVKMVF